uniref:Uncharacterized protein n=1 Tax=Romanomermis culicivorax TaxID=13658 RepID=A0A915IJG0_ROMCU
MKCSGSTQKIVSLRITGIDGKNFLAHEWQTEKLKVYINNLTRWLGFLEQLSTLASTISFELKA